MHSSHVSHNGGVRFRDPPYLSPNSARPPRKTVVRKQQNLPMTSMGSMSTETTFTRRWKRPSPAFVLVIVITVVGLLISFGLPNLVLAKFANQPTALLFQVRVIDDQGVPIPNANVTVSGASAQTGLDGSVAITRDYLAKGVKGLTGTCRLRGDIRVECPGYIPWRAPLTDVFGRNYNYIDKGTNIIHEVTLRR